VVFGNRIDPAIHDRVLAFAGAVSRRRWKHVRDIVPTYASVTVYRDFCAGGDEAFAERLLTLAQTVQTAPRQCSPCLRIPVCYGGSFGPDLDLVAHHGGLSPEEVIALFTSVQYRVYMVGFTPGFPYMGSVPTPIAVPRRVEPRVVVPAGSVGIAGFQTGIYPQATPGGWQLIGRTPVRLYDLSQADPFLFKPGDRVELYPVNETDFHRLSTQSMTRHSLQRGADAPRD
jgi:inhibitor of KinA